MRPSTSWQIRSEPPPTPRPAIEDNRRAIEEAALLGAPVLVLVCGPVVDRDVAGSVSMIRDGIAAVLGDAAEHGVALGIEPLHPMMAADRSAITRIDDAVRIIEDLGAPPGVGVVVDAYHVWWDCLLEEQLRRAAGRILGFHVSDWVSPLTGGLTDGRGIMGDGAIDLGRMASLVAGSGYAGPVEIEIISADLSRQPSDDLLPTVLHRFEQIE